MLRVYIGGCDHSDPLNTGLRFYLVDENDFDKRRHIIRIVNGTTLHYDDIGEGGVAVDPSFSLNAQHGQEFLKAMAELAYERGIRLKADETRQGKIEATEKHLEDMRRLVFEERK